MSEMEKLIFGETWDSPMLEYMKQMVDIACSSKMGINLTKVGLDLPCGQHSHKDYEFMIPISGIPDILIGNNNIKVENNTVYPIVSLQPHGMEKAAANCRILNIVIKHGYLDDIGQNYLEKDTVSFEHTKFKLKDELKILIKMFMDECKYKQTGYEFIMESLSNQIVVNLIRSVENDIYSLDRTKSKQPKTNIDRAIEFLRECYSLEFSLQDVAKTVNLSPYHFSRVFKDQMGKTTYQYLMEIKIARAKELLAETRLSIKEIYLMCGFNSNSHFSSMFSKIVGVAPTEYRNIAGK